MENLEHFGAEPKDVGCILKSNLACLCQNQSTIAAIETAGLRDLVKILVGGAPVNQRFAGEIGADGYGETATDAVALARQMVSVPAHAN